MNNLITFYPSVLGFLGYFIGSYVNHTFALVVSLAASFGCFLIIAVLLWRQSKKEERFIHETSHFHIQ